MIERKEYMNLLEKWRDKKAIKVVTAYDAVASHRC